MHLSAFVRWRFAAGSRAHHLRARNDDRPGGCAMSFALTVAASGTYRHFCPLHPHIQTYQGVVIVR